MKNRLIQMAEPSVAIILLNYCNYEDTITCVKTLKKIDYENYIIFIIDNHSPNESLKKLYILKEPKIQIIDSGKNGGFAYGNNIGIQYALEAGMDYILLLNNDTLVEPDFLSELINKGVQKAKGDIITCRIMYNFDKDKVWYAGGEIDWDNLRAIHYGFNKNVNSINNKLNEVTFISGCCMLISRTCIEKIGMLSEEYFMYYEDVDYCQHAMEKGAKLVYVPSSIIYHCVSAAGGGSNSSFVIEWNNRSRRKFYRKYKNNIKKGRRIFIYIKCEICALIKILLGNHRIKSLKAYCKSFLYNQK
ncbi:MAG: glycosyltransferase family 2 protein [Eubacterium sp.]|jgi:GT2 family glycosyltransferase|nr:glycosyltransferase family 2 protein [Eubacterium sp.]